MLSFVVAGLVLVVGCASETTEDAKAPTGASALERSTAREAKALEVVIDKPAMLESALATVVVGDVAGGGQSDGELGSNEDQDQRHDDDGKEHLNEGESSMSFD